MPKKPPRPTVPAPAALTDVGPLARSLAERFAAEGRVALTELERLLPEDATAEEMDEVFYALSELGVQVLQKQPPPKAAHEVSPAGPQAGLASESQPSPAPPAVSTLLEEEPHSAPCTRGEGDSAALGTVAQYLADVSSIPPLTEQEEEALASRAAAGDSRAANALVEAHLRLVVRICREYRHTRLPRMDLIQAGNLGLMDAAHHFTPDRTGRFAHFASWWVRRAITRHVEASGLLIRLPRKMVQEVHAVGRERARLRAQLKREPSTLDVASSLGWPTSKVEFLSSAGHDPMSLDAPLPTDTDKQLEEVVVDPRAAEQAQATRKRHVIASLRPFIDRLPIEERSVLKLRYGLSDRVVRSVSEVSNLTSLPAEEVRRLEREGLRRLAESSRSVLPAPFEDDD